MKCKDIPDIPILDFINSHNGGWCNWCFGDDKDVRKAMPKLPSAKLALAKMRQLMKRGLVDGCSCGCRGDFILTNKGKNYLMIVKEREKS